METTTRSTGTAVYGYIVGGGYQGQTEELDNIVQSMAEVLQSVYHKDIEIRFNSDGYSGGAWLKNSIPGFGGNCQVGLSAGLTAIKPDNMEQEDFFKLESWEWRKLPQQLYIRTYLSNSVVKSKDILNSGNSNSRYASHQHKTIADAVQFLKENVNVNKILK